AGAADVPRPIYKAPPPVAAVQTWTGFYAGMHGGWGWTTDKRAFSTTNAVNGAGAFVGLDPSALDLRSNSPLFGAQVGFKWQVDPSWVLGIEGDITGTGLKSAATANPLCNTAWCGVPTPAPTGALTAMQRDINWLASIRGRLGYAWGP